MSNSSTSAPVPRLAPPGAGLPLPELWIARLLVGLHAATGSRERFFERFRLERREVARLLETANAEAGAERVLIPRLPGLEDSSRYWSVWMTLDHLRIVHQAMARVIRSLGQGQMPPGRASTADVKPSPDAGPEVRLAYEESCDLVLEAVAEVPDLRTTVRYPHPWFGPMDAHAWFALAGGHLGIHRRQIAQILRLRL